MFDDYYTRDFFTFLMARGIYARDREEPGVTTMERIFDYLDKNNIVITFNLIIRL